MKLGFHSGAFFNDPLTVIIPRLAALGYQVKGVAAVEDGVHRVERQGFVGQRVAGILGKEGEQVVKLLPPHFLEADKVGLLVADDPSAVVLAMDPVVVAVVAAEAADIAGDDFHVRTA